MYVMRKERHDGGSLKEILDRWEGCVIAGLRLVYRSSSNKWIVSDENCVDGSQRSYSKRIMEKIFTAAK